MKLYDVPRSGNCHKIRMLLSLLQLPHELIAVDLPGGETRSPEFLKLNPRGQVPVLEDEGQVIWDSQAILVYLARKYGGEQWLPAEPLALARAMQWLAVSENELLYGLARARAALQFKAPWNLEECQALGAKGLRLLENQLAGREWLAGQQATIADIACYPYVALTPQTGLSLDDSPSVMAWIKRIQAWPGYVGMPGMA
jgi:glutathione S-transferase